jgi:hypothetical protein
VRLEPVYRDDLFTVADEEAESLVPSLEDGVRAVV